MGNGVLAGLLTRLIVSSAVKVASGGVLPGTIAGQLAGQVAQGAVAGGGRGGLFTPGGDMPGKIATDVINQLGNNEDIAVVPTKPMYQSTEGWAAVLGAGLTLAYASGLPMVAPQVSQAADTLAGLFGFPPGVGTLAVLVAPYAYIWVRRKWFTRTITPAAANVGYNQGKVL